MPLTLTFISLLLDVSKSFDTIDRCILNRVLSSLGLPCLVPACSFRISYSC